MKKILIGLLLCLVSISCVEILQAQSFPLTVRVEWSPNPTTDAVTQYIVVFNGGSPVTVDPTTCSATVCKSTDFTVNSAALYTATVTAVNQWGSSVGTFASVQISVPGKSGNVKITR